MRNEQWIRDRLASHIRELMLLEREGFGDFFKRTLEAKIVELELILDG